MKSTRSVQFDTSTFRVKPKGENCTSNCTFDKGYYTIRVKKNFITEEM